MQADLAPGRCDKSGMPTGVDSLPRQAARSLLRKRTMRRARLDPWRAPSRCNISSFVCFPSHFDSQSLQQPETWFMNKTVPAQRILKVASFDGAEYALSDSGPGLTSCPINYANVLSMLRPDNLPTWSNATGGSVECIGLLPP